MQFWISFLDFENKDKILNVRFRNLFRFEPVLSGLLSFYFKETGPILSWLLQFFKYYEVRKSYDAFKILQKFDENMHHVIDKSHVTEMKDEWD